MLIKDSTLQQLELFPLPAKQLIFSFLFMAFPPPRQLPSSAARISFWRPVFIFLINQITLINLTIQIMFVKRFFCAQISLTHFFGVALLALVREEERPIVGYWKGRSPWEKIP
jgi:hypothetical protein